MLICTGLTNSPKPYPALQRSQTIRRKQNNSTLLLKCTGFAGSPQSCPALQTVSNEQKATKLINTYVDSSCNCHRKMVVDRKLLTGESERVALGRTRPASDEENRLGLFSIVCSTYASLLASTRSSPAPSIRSEHTPVIAGTAIEAAYR